MDNHAVNFDVLAVDPFYRGVVDLENPRMVTWGILLPLCTFAEENHSAQQRSQYSGVSARLDGLRIELAAFAAALRAQELGKTSVMTEEGLAHHYAIIVF